jgi:hypothetical protein
MNMTRDAGFYLDEAKNADEAIVILESRLDITVVFTGFKCHPPQADAKRTRLRSRASLISDSYDGWGLHNAIKLGHSGPPVG